MPTPCPGRTETLIPLVRKTFGDDFDLHGDSNSSYDPAHAIPVGRMLEENNYVYYEEPCEFDALEENKKVRDTLSIPVALGEQEFSEVAVPLVHRQPRLRHRAARPVLLRRHDPLAACGAHGAGWRRCRPPSTSPAASDSCTCCTSLAWSEDIGKYQEYKLGMEKYGALVRSAHHREGRDDDACRRDRASASGIRAHCSKRRRWSEPPLPAGREKTHTGGGLPV